MKARIVTLLALLGINQHLSAEQKQDLVTAGVQSAPGVAAAGGARVLGLPLSDWAVMATISFIALQAGYLVWKWRRDYLRELERRQGGRPVPTTDLGALEADE